MFALQRKINEYLRIGTMANLVDNTGVSSMILERIRKGCHKNGKYRRNTLDILYCFFSLEKDDWYKDNMKKNVKPSESVLGEIFRKKRIAMGLSIEQVQARIKVDSRQIARIEAGDSLPTYSSYTMTSMLALYNFDEEDREKIRWFVTILHEVIRINNAM